jgi:hypothetical protein
MSNIRTLYLTLLSVVQFPNMDDDDRMSMEYANPQADDVQPTVHLLPSVSTLISQYDRTSAPPLGMNDDNFPVEDALVSVTPHRLPYGSGLANLGNTCFMVRRHCFESHMFPCFL